MEQYVRCINNNTLFADDMADDMSPHLIVGHVYKVVPPHKNDGDMVRVIDGSGEDYLYPATYFEPFLPTTPQRESSITIHLEPYVKGVLQAEAAAARKPMSALVRQWIDEQLDLPIVMDWD